MTGVAVIHASCVRLDRAGDAFGAPRSAGVLLMGKSGAGKSDLTLRLIAMGAKLVADDYTELFVRRGTLYARAPDAIAGLIEARGIGVIALPFAREAKIVLAVEPGKPERMPEIRRFHLPRALGLAQNAAPELIKIVPLEASAAAKIALAAAASVHGLRRDTATPYKSPSRKRT
jgi:HPr kinase/phosphorylase